MPSSAMPRPTSHDVVSLEMCLRCSNLRRMDRRSQSDGFAVVSVKEPLDEVFMELGRTDTVWDDSDPSFVTKFRVNTLPPGARVHVEVYDRDSKSEDLRRHDFIGSCTFIFGELLRSAPKPLEVELLRAHSEKSGGRLILALDRVWPWDPRRVLTFTISFAEVRHEFSSMRRCYLQLSRWSSAGMWVPVYRSEVRTVNLGSEFDMFSLEGQVLNSGGDRSVKSRFEVVKVYKRFETTKTVAMTDFSVCELLAAPNGSQLPLTDRAGQPLRAYIEVTENDQQSNDFALRLTNF